MNTIVITSYKERKRPTKPSDFEGISRHHNVKIMLHEPQKDSGKNTKSICWLVCGKIQYKRDLPTIKMGLLGGHYFCIKKIGALCKRRECKSCTKIFTPDGNLIKNPKRGDKQEVKQKYLFSR